MLYKLNDDVLCIIYKYIYIDIYDIVLNDLINYIDIKSRLLFYPRYILLWYLILSCENNINNENYFSHIIKYWDIKKINKKINYYLASMNIKNRLIFIWNLIYINKIYIKKNLILN
tara:strand:- start:1427 stop:1774 length:348 start_codon:yes stop_codon:yes gene_type:complete